MRQSFKLIPISFIALLVYSCTEVPANSNSAEKPIVVKVSNVVSYNQVENQRFPFISKPYRSSELSFRVGGPVVKLDINSGSFYRKGETIASIDTRDYEIKLQKAKAIYTQSLLEFQRIEALYKMNNISASVYDQSKAEKETTEATYKNAENELNDTRLTAPFDGYVQQTFFEQHQDIKPSQPICSFIEVAKLKLEFYVSQQTAMSLKKNDKIEFYFDAMPNEPLVANIEDISKGAANNNLSFLITAVYENILEKLPSGMSGQIVIKKAVSSSQKPAIAISAVRNSPTSGSYVWKSENGVAKKADVKIGKILKNGLIEIKEGVSIDDKIIVTGLELLSESKPIQESGTNNI